MSNNNETILKASLEKWWKQLSVVVHALSGAGLPTLSGEQLWRTEVGRQLDILVRIAAGKIDRSNSHNVYMVNGAMNVVYGVLLYRPSPPGMESEVPTEYFNSPVGQLYLLADVWMDRDLLITLSEASELTGRSLSNLSNLLSRRVLTKILDPDEPNPTYATRVRLSNVRSLSQAPLFAHLSYSDYMKRFYDFDLHHEHPLDGNEQIEDRGEFDPWEWMDEIIRQEGAMPNQESVVKLIDMIQSGAFSRQRKRKSSRKKKGTDDAQ